MNLSHYSLRQLFQVPVILGGCLGNLSRRDDYAAAKNGDFDAAIRLALEVVQPSIIQQLQGIPADAVLGVLGQESSGPNAIPTAVAAVIAKRLNIALAYGVVNLSASSRTSLDGLGRVFSRPVFFGQVKASCRYILVDDTLTQGGTFAALAKHIFKQGSEVAAMVALTGKEYSRVLVPTDITLQRLRAQLGDVEDDFQKATGRCFEELTESEARYLANFKPTSTVQQRIADALKFGMGGEGC